LNEKDANGDIVWVLCAENEATKIQWMSKIAEVKIAMQKNEANIHLHGVDGEAIV